MTWSRKKVKKMANNIRRRTLTKGKETHKLLEKKWLRVDLGPLLLVIFLTSGGPYILLIDRIERMD